MCGLNEWDAGTDGVLSSGHGKAEITICSASSTGGDGAKVGVYFFLQLFDGLSAICVSFSCGKGRSGMVGDSWIPWYQSLAVGLREYYLPVGHGRDERYFKTIDGYLVDGKGVLKYYEMSLR